METTCVRIVFLQTPPLPGSEPRGALLHCCWLYWQSGAPRCPELFVSRMDIDCRRCRLRRQGRITVRNAANVHSERVIRHSGEYLAGIVSSWRIAESCANGPTACCHGCYPPGGWLNIQPRYKVDRGVLVQRPLRGFSRSPSSSSNNEEGHWVHSPQSVKRTSCR